MIRQFLHRDESGALAETVVERQVRLAHEGAFIEEADAEIDAGHGIADEDARELLRAFAQGRAFPVPDLSKPETR